MLKRPMSSFSLRVILFLAPLCPICQDMTFDLRLLEEEFAGDPIEFIGVFPNASTTTEQMADFRERYGLDMACTPDTMGWQERLGACWTPEVFVLDERDSILYQGRINDRYFAPGRRRNKTRQRDLHHALTDILAQRPVEVPITTAVGCPIEGIKVVPSKNPTAPPTGLPVHH